MDRAIETRRKVRFAQGSTTTTTGVVKKRSGAPLIAGHLAFSFRQWLYIAWKYRRKRGIYMLSTTERDLFETLRSFGVFENIDREKLPPAVGSITILCGDGTHSRDTVSHTWDTFEACQKCNHLFAFNGGALCVTPKSPFMTEGGLEFVTRNIEGTFPIMAKKGLPIGIVAAMSHWPCGQAKAAGLSMPEVIELSFEAKAALKGLVRKVESRAQVIAEMHLHIEGERKRTYRLNQERWESWLLENPGLLAA